MDGAEALRSARRRVGCSQRELASLAGVSASTVAAIESGARTASLATLSALLEAAGLELSVDVHVPGADPELRAHLRNAMPTRLHRALGGSGNLLTAPPRGWRQLLRLSGYGPVSLFGPLAAGVWLPGLDVPDVFAVRFRHLQPMPLPDTSDLQLVQDDAQEIASVHTGIGIGWGVRVPSPAELALDPACAAHRLGLRAAARVLHDEPARDLAGRRVAAHRDPEHDLEAARIFHTKRWGRLPLPGPRDRRSWRLQDQASMHAWLRSLGYPV